MNTLTRPTLHQIIQFCDNMKEVLVAAHNRGSLVEIGNKQITEEVKSPDYGDTIVDALYVGAKFRARFVERGYEWSLLD